MRSYLNKIKYRIIRIVLPGLFLFSCNSGESLKRKVEYISSKPNDKAYEYRLAAMTYIFKSGKDLDYSMGLVDYFIKEERFAEARYALDQLAEIHGEIPGIYYLRAVCYRNESMFKKAEDEITKALLIDPENELFLKEQENISFDKRSWSEILMLNERIRKEGKTPFLLYERGKLLVQKRYYEESFYDLNALLEQDTLVDEAYQVLLESMLFRRQYENADTLVRAWKEKTESGLNEAVLSLADNLEKLLSLKKIYTSASFQQSDLISYARLLAGFGDFKEGDNVLIAGLKRFPNDYKLLYSRLLLNIETGKKDVARDILQSMNSLGMSVDPKIRDLLK